MGNDAGEPSIGVNWNTGNIFFQSFASTLRVTFDDSVAPATAKWVSAGVGPQAFFNLDPILFTDRDSGRTFAGGLDGACSILAYTDDDGATWTPMTNACAAPAYDHETIASGAWHQPVPAAAQSDRAVYYCAHEDVQMCAVSLDGGFSFLPGVPLGMADCLGFVGHVKVASDGTAYVPAYNCLDGKQAVFVTQNNGLTWQHRPIAPSTRAAHWTDPSVALSDGGRVYAAWVGDDNQVYAARSQSQGRFWSGAADLGASVGVKAATFPAAVAGDDDRAAVAFLGTRDSGDAFASTFNGVWHLFVAFTTDGGASWTTVQASQDPVQRGWICSSGTTCTTGRNLLDFIDATLDKEGHVLVAYADGCVDACAGPAGTKAQSTAAKATIARQSGGDCLYAARCGAASGVFSPAGILPDQCGSDTVIFSSNSAGVPSLNAHAGACLAPQLLGVGAPGADTAIINPGSDRVSVRYVSDAGTPSLVVVLEGLGAQATLTMTRVVSTTGSVTYDSPLVAIDPAARGSIHATVLTPGLVEVDHVTFHTVA